MRGKRSHKGRNRYFTAPEEIDRQTGRKKEESEPEEEADPATTGNEELTGGEEVRHKGVSHLIEVHNPNEGVPPEKEGPSRKEAEAAAKAVINPLKLKSEAELASDMARLALVRKEREQAALKREQEKQAREAQREAAAQRAQAKLEALRQKGKPGGHKKTQASGAAGETTPKMHPSDSTIPSVVGDT
ncbi:unnamed protein product [Calicophoron daubneyi]|uniref:Casein kinase substrate phosphoprotein PP28 domain-containing protein n=1 Tax=Calicophoron daubneyi TaxID=300641 RepID=A0AAV2U0M3_CALDB